MWYRLTVQEQKPIASLYTGADACANDEVERWQKIALNHRLGVRRHSIALHKAQEKLRRLLGDSKS